MISLRMRTAGPGLRALGAAVVVAALCGGCRPDGAGGVAEGLASANPVAREAALERIGQMRDTNAVPDLVARLVAARGDAAALPLAQTLGRIGDPRAVEPLVAALETGPEEVSVAAAEALGKIRDPRAVPALAAALDNARVRPTALWALGSIGDRQAVPALAGRLSDPDETVAYLARQALKKIPGGD